MTKNQYLDSLYTLLKTLDEQKKKQILFEYEERISELIESGKSEKEAVASLKTPQAVAAENGIYMSYSPSGPSSLIKSIFAGISLLFLNLFIVIPPLALIIGLLIGLFGLSVGLLIGGFAGFAGILFAPLFPVFIDFHEGAMLVLSNGMFRYGISLLLLGLSSTGAVFLILVAKTCEIFFKFLKSYIMWNINIIKR